MKEVTKAIAKLKKNTAIAAGLEQQWEDLWVTLLRGIEELVKDKLVDAKSTVPLLTYSWTDPELRDILHSKLKYSFYKADSETVAREGMWLCAYHHEASLEQAIRAYQVLSKQVNHTLLNQSLP